MKKRRELDALVSNGKLGRSRKPKLKKGEHELLRNESGSSEEEFSLPAQKTVSRKRGPSRFCATCLTVFGFLLIVACIVACGGLVWMHLGLKRELDQLRGQLRSVVSGSKGSSDELQTIHSQLATLTKTVEGYKTGSNGLDKISHNISTIFKQIGTLNQNSADLQKSIAAAPELKNLPSTVADLSNNVASMGSEIKTLQSRVESLETSHKEMAENVQEVRNKVYELVRGNTGVPAGTATEVPAPQESGALNKYYSQQLSQLQTALERMNASLVEHFSTMNANITSQQLRLVGLRNETVLLGTRLELVELRGTSKSGSNVSTANMRALIQAAVNSAVGQLGNMSSQDKNTQNALFQNVYGQIENITSLVQNFQTQLDQVKSDQSAMSTDKVNLNVTAGWNKIIENSNAKSQAKWNEQFENLSGRMENLKKTLDQLSTTVNYLTVIGKNNHHNKVTGTPITVVTGTSSPVHASEGSTTPPPGAVEGEEVKVEGSTASSGPETGAESPSASTTPMPTEGSLVSPNNATLSQNATATPAGEQGNASGSTTTTVKPTAGVSWIKNHYDVQTNFYRWDQDGDGFVNYENLPEFMGPQTPSKELLLTYDANKDGRWTLEEMQKAFGFPAPTTPSPEEEAYKPPVEGGSPLSKRESNAQPDTLHDIVKALEGGS